ncbi:TRAIL-like protein [Sea otter poxvirus]|uniref:TRAIL-like protein n=1 Tax=Sea otter poxvirus TaxID=1416741 RepID=A0A2U9QHK2_9POXV|nr:TRAIL-like protein [Sea otter poxvirus]AWU47081.1 TRAIL-like protein [Sea otter poxvirus]
MHSTMISRLYNSTTIIIVILNMHIILTFVAYLYTSSEIYKLDGQLQRLDIVNCLNDFNDLIDDSNCNSYKLYVKKVIRNVGMQYFGWFNNKKVHKHSKVIAHVTGNVVISSSNRNITTLGKKILWKPFGSSFMAYNIYLDDGELIITQPGFYYIYSQVYFWFQEPVSGNHKNKQLIQYIYKVTNYPDPILLMKSARNSCWSTDSQYGIYTIYQGGVFYLQAYDRIYVSVTNHHLLSMDQRSSYVGAFIVG